MKKSALLILLILGKSPTAHSEEKKNLIKDNKIIQKTGQTIKKTGEAVGEAVEKVSQTIAEPILNPKAARSHWFDFDPQIESGEKKNINILPLVVSSPERGFGLGLKFAQESMFRKSDVLRIHTVQTLKNKSSYRLSYKLPPNLFKKAGGELELGYENYGRFYYGVGNLSSKSDESEYVPELFEARVPLLYGLTKNLSVGLSLNFQNWKIIETGSAGILRRDLPNLIGKEASRLYTSSLLLRWDSRNSQTDPSQGLFLESAVEYSKKLLGSETDFLRSTFEIRKFYPLFHRPERHVFAVRLFMDYKSGEVPFYLLPELGGIFFNRGLLEGRFRDTLALCGNWEYRFKIYERLHWAFFVDGGNVYSDYYRVNEANIKITGGTGMRYYVPPGNLLLARIDAGYSIDGLQIYLTFDHPF